MIKKRIIFALLFQDGFFYLSRNFKLQKVGDLNWLINNFGFGKTCDFIDELICILVKKEPSENDKKLFLKEINELRKKLFIPLTLGGNIRNLEDVNSFFLNGADKILLNTSAYDINFNKKICEIYGEQSISIMIDYSKYEDNSGDKIFINGGKNYKMTLFDFFNIYENKIKYGEIILNSIEDDGTGNGLDLRVIEKLEKVIKKKPVLLMGGAGKPEHISEVLKNKYIAGVVTANLFNFLGTGLEASRKLSLKENINLAKFSGQIKL